MQTTMPMKACALRNLNWSSTSISLSLFLSCQPSSLPADICGHVSVVTRGPFSGILNPDLSSRSRRIECLSTWLYGQFPNNSLVHSEASDSEHKEHVCFVYIVRLYMVQFSFLTIGCGVSPYTCG